MRKLSSGQGRATVQLSSDDLLILSNSLNEVCHGIDVPEFTSRIGVSRERAEELFQEVRGVAEAVARETDEEWFAVRCVFRGTDDPPVHEERVTLWRAASFEAAIERAETEAREYAEVLSMTYLGLAQAYKLADEPGDGAEVFSLCRESALGPKEYLDAFFDTGAERQRDVGDPGDPE